MTHSDDVSSDAVPASPVGSAGGAQDAAGTSPQPKRQHGCRKEKVKATRERILKAAAQMFADNDYHCVKTDDVAQTAGVGKGTLFRHFKTKEDLFLAVLSFAVDTTTDRIKTKIEHADTPIERLRVACKHTLRFFRENKGLFRVLHHHEALKSVKGKADLNRKRDRLRHFVEDIIIEGRESGAFDVDDPGFASAMLWTMLRSAHRSCDPKMPLGELSQRVAELFLRGVLVRKP